LWVGRLRYLEIALVMAIVLAAVIGWLVILWRRKRQ
jgi:hypothetical protein